MAANQPPWPREWLMTDERIDDALPGAIARVPVGGGVLFRHHDTPTAQRTSLANDIAKQCAERGLALAIARDVGLARQLGAVLVHNPATDAGGLPFSMSAHSLTQAREAWESGAAMIFLSPLFDTRSHPGGSLLPLDTAAEIVARSPVPVIALGGMDRARFADIAADGYYGWAGIDAWIGTR